MIPEDRLYMPIVPVFPAGSAGVQQSCAMFSAIKQCVP